MLIGGYIVEYAVYDVLDSSSRDPFARLVDHLVVLRLALLVCLIVGFNLSIHDRNQLAHHLILATLLRIFTSGDCYVRTSLRRYGPSLLPSSHRASHHCRYRGLPCGSMHSAYAYTCWCHTSMLIFSPFAPRVRG